MEASISGLSSTVTATGTVRSVPGELIGFYVNSTTAGTLLLRDGGAGGTPISGTMTPAVGWHFLPVRFSINLHATIGGSLDVTLVYK